MGLIGPIKLLLVVALYLSLSHYGVEEGMSVIFKEEELEFERQLKSLNKPPVKTIQTEVGDIVDCIDIHKQSAFDHPLLKNHKIQLRPTTLQKVLAGGTASNEKYSKSKLRSIDCPQGTVPIPRTQKEDLLRAKSFSNSYAANIHPHTTAFPGQHRAILRSIEDTKMTYEGVTGTMSVYNPTVEDGQASSAQLWIENGPVNEVNGLQTGWMVAPRLFADNKTRPFIYWTVNGRTGCFNYMCNGFVQVDKELFLGGNMGSISEYNGKQWELTMTIIRDQVSGNWWLTTIDETNNERHVGYWPKELLPHLVEGASRVAWGGLAKGPPNGAAPPMGNGHFPDGHYYHAGWFQKIQIIDASKNFVNPRESRLQSVVDNPKCYDLIYYGYQKKVGHTFMFGGPGGYCGM